MGKGEGGGETAFCEMKENEVFLTKENACLRGQQGGGEGFRMSARNAKMFKKWVGGEVMRKQRQNCVGDERKELKRLLVCDSRGQCHNFHEYVLINGNI